MSPPLMEPDLIREDEVRRLGVRDGRKSFLPISKEPRGRTGDRGVETFDVPCVAPEFVPMGRDRSDIGVVSSAATAL
jgi:hypothetical protein